jgi:hypothetical protein
MHNIHTTTPKAIEDFHIRLIVILDLVLEFYPDISNSCHECFVATAHQAGSDAACGCEGPLQLNAVVDARAR